MDDASVGSGQLAGNPSRTNAARRRAKCGASSFHFRAALPTIAMAPSGSCPRRRPVATRRKREPLCQRRVDRRLRVAAKDQVRPRCRLRSMPSSTRASASSRRRQAEAVVAERAGKDQRKPAGSVLEFTQRDFIGERRIGVIDPRHHLPRRCARPPSDGPRIAPAGRERLDGAVRRRWLLTSRSNGAPLSTASTSLRQSSRVAEAKSAASGRVSGSVMAAKCHAGRSRPTQPFRQSPIRGRHSRHI